MPERPHRKAFPWMLTIMLAAGVLLSPAPARPQVAPNLGPEPLKILVSGVALYPDGLLTTILEASAHPLQIRAAAEGDAPAGWGGPLARIRRQARAAATDPSVEALKAYPEILSALNANLPMTFRLGIAYRNQPADVWAAIRSVRADVQLRTQAAAPPPQAAAPQPAARTVLVTQPPPVIVTDYAAASAAVVAGLMLNAYAINELAQAVESTSSGAATTVATTTTTTTAPSSSGTTTTTTGTASTAPAGATVTGGTTTTSGTYTTPSGGTVTTGGQGGGVSVQGQSGSAAAGVGTRTVTGPGGNSATVTGPPRGAPTPPGTRPTAAWRGREP